MRQRGHIVFGIKWAAVVVLLLILGCTKDEVITVGKNELAHTSNLLKFNIGMSASWAPDIIGGEGELQTKSQYLSLPLLNEDGSESGVYISMVEEDMPAVIDTVYTRSDDAGSQDSAPFAGIYAFQVPYSGDEIPEYDANADGITTFMDNVSLSKDGVYSGGEKFWPTDGNYLKFFAYSPYYTKPDGTSGEGENYVVSAEGNQPTITYTVPTDVSKQKDVLEAVTDNLTLNIANAGNTAGGVELQFKHLLSKVEVIPNSVAEGVITEVRIKGINGSGTRSIGIEGDNIWSLDDDIVTDYTQLVTMEGGSYVFFLMPQSLSDDAIIEVDIKVTSTPADGSTTDKERKYTLKRKLKGLPVKWEHNKHYKYIISTPQEVDVEVSDEVNGNVKSNLVIKNTGMADAYIRVGLVGYWKVDHLNGDVTEELIVSDWKMNEDGVFVGLNTNPNNWKQGEDGYYYYMKKVGRGTEIPDRLFESYTLNENSAPVADAYLELVINVQAVLDTDAKWVWPNDIVSSLK